MVELVSVHVPKCAGTSFLDALTEAFGRDAIYRDYDDRPVDPAAPVNLDPAGFFERAHAGGYPLLAGKRVVHGHFHARKYAALGEGVRRIAFLREPIDRMISHYYYWMSTPLTDHALRSYVVRNRLSVYEFARLPLIHDFYTRTFFSGVDLGTFAFVGFFETYREDVARLSARLGTHLPMRSANANKAGRYGDRRAELLADAALMASLRDLMRADLAFYDAARARFGT